MLRTLYIYNYVSILLILINFYETNLQINTILTQENKNQYYFQVK